jgi:hypothetical protein
LSSQPSWGLMMMRTATKASAQQCHVQPTYFDFGDLGLNFNQGFNEFKVNGHRWKVSTMN